MTKQRIKYKHLGTDCSHTKKGMCDRCKDPRAIRRMNGKLFDPLGAKKK